MYNFDDADAVGYYENDETCTIILFINFAKNVYKYLYIWNASFYRLSAFVYLILFS